jgi:GAF domain-containing protein
MAAISGTLICWQSSFFCEALSESPTPPWYVLSSSLCHSREDPRGAFAAEHCRTVGEMMMAQDLSLIGILSDDGVPLESVLCTDELNQRPSRPPDYETENRALLLLGQTLADSPRTILQTLADTILDVFRAGSAGISLLTKEDGGKTFYWPAIAGVWKPHIGGGTPRDFGPCGDVLDCGTPLLFRHFERRYPYLRPVAPLVEECLLVPFYVEGKAVGTIWAIAHDEHRRFDAEDLRQLQNLSRFASAAFQVIETLTASERREEALRHSNAELALAERALRDADRRKDIFVATVAHELRQPIAAMLPAVAMIGERASEQSGKRARAVITADHPSWTHGRRPAGRCPHCRRQARPAKGAHRRTRRDSGRGIQHIIVIRRASSQVIRVAAG